MRATFGLIGSLVDVPDDGIHKLPTIRRGEIPLILWWPTGYNFLGAALFVKSTLTYQTNIYFERTRKQNLGCVV